jgi:hypothetical protein
MEKTLKVSDFVSIKESSIKSLDSMIVRLEEIKDTYKSAGDDDILLLENIKKELSGILISYSFLLPEIKTYKDGNHIYLGERRKLLKANVLDEIVKSGKFNFTNAKEMVYADEKYIKHLEFIHKLKRKFIMYEDVYVAYSNLLNSIIQSISVFSRTINLNN